ncbi:hypothetical protein [Actinomadura harenae]|uniref:Uncharacterized protein n=1 Tax=Actinomadura harenae TaxID=2483351 RepID=A0A3M2M191_9ACTN|nr:hypothetical protein [Actinomadura harenae]RMI42195.1 hypothetical protein EBO15_20405 [Actinomadura harenae]
MTIETYHRVRARDGFVAARVLLALQAAILAVPVAYLSFWGVGGPFSGTRDGRLAVILLIPALFFGAVIVALLTCAVRLSVHKPARRAVLAGEGIGAGAYLLWDFHGAFWHSTISSISFLEFAAIPAALYLLLAPSVRERG